MKRLLLGIFVLTGIGTVGHAQSTPSVLIIHDVTVIDVTGAPAQPHRVVIVRDGKIEEVGNSGGGGRETAWSSCRW
jgi:imidazolonepropionase-like amidohydrolase